MKYTAVFCLVCLVNRSKGNYTDAVLSQAGVNAVGENTRCL